MINSQSNTDNRDMTMQALERTRKRIKYALSMANSELMDFETMDEICRSLSLALGDLDAANSAVESKQLAA